MPVRNGADQPLLRWQRPLSLTILVLAPVSSMNTSRAGSNMNCSRLQRRRARATSGRSSSAACRLFFKGEIVSRKKPPDCSAAGANRKFAHHCNHHINCQIRVLATRASSSFACFSNRDLLPPVGFALALPVSRGATTVCGASRHRLKLWAASAATLPLRLFRSRVPANHQNKALASLGPPKGQLRAVKFLNSALVGIPQFN